MAEAIARPLTGEQKDRLFGERFRYVREKKRYVSGETHLYLGRQYRLRIRQADEAAIKLIGQFFHVHLPRPDDPTAVAEAMDAWYRSHAESLLRDRLDRCLESAASPRLAEVNLRIRPMKRRWGSCSEAGTITLNVDLVKAPLHCIDYVIVHELCHLRIHDHSPAFFRMPGRCMPDWESRKARLDSVVLR